MHHRIVARLAERDLDDTESGDQADGDGAAESAAPDAVAGAGGAHDSGNGAEET